jgi:hypothetical protein
MYLDLSSIWVINCETKEVNKMEEWEAIDIYEGLVLEVFFGSLNAAMNYFSKVLLPGSYEVRTALLV